MDARYFADKFAAALPYERYHATGTDEQRRRWPQVFEAARLTSSLASLVSGLTREMKVLVVSGIWVRGLHPTVSTHTGDRGAESRPERPAAPRPRREPRPERAPPASRQRPGAGGAVHGGGARALLRRRRP